MCDYSLMHKASRPAQVGEVLTSTAFSSALSRGFCGADNPDVAVCVMPGTELAFAEDIQVRGWLGGNSEIPGARVARFRQINKSQPNSHHDALELPDGKIVMVNDLVVGQKITVLQLPAAPQNEAEAKEQERLEVTA